MEYKIEGKAISKGKGTITTNDKAIEFGITNTFENLPNPAERFLSSIAACILKNVERFSGLMKFEYYSATIKVSGVRFAKPPRMKEVCYHLTIFTNEEHINLPLLKKNIEKFGTIYNTVKATCSITGTIQSSTQ